MSDPDDQTSNNFITTTTTTRPFDLQQQQHMRECFMDFDFDFDSSWPLDHLTLMSSSNPSFSSEQPFSPLWGFSDSAAAAPADDVRPPSADHLRFLPYAVDSGHENINEVDDRRRMPSPFIGMLPLDNPDSYFVIKERMTQALRYFKEWTEQHILAQVWAPVKNGGRDVLTTTGQPFVLGPNGNGLHQYRMVSVMYMFNADGENDGELGLPGRVFRKKLPEWTPDVQYYSDREYSRLNHALQHNVRGTLALPVFEPSGQACVGVVELIMTSQKINYAPEVDKVCKALEAVNLKSSDILDHPTSTQICNEGRQNALAEILEILTVVCETHKLPLAQTWVPCRHRSVLAHGGGLKKSCTSIDGSCMGQVCMSTTDVSFYIVDAHMWGFREACVEHHLQKGQGVAGRAFLSQSSCFCRDITQFRKTDYPLVHYARMFGLNSCFAICLRSSYTGDDDYILEFFLPPNIKGKVELDRLLGTILATMRQHFKSISVASGINLRGEMYVETVQASAIEMIDSMYELIQIPNIVRSPSQLEISLGAREIVGQELSQKPSGVELDIPNNGNSAINAQNDKGDNNHMSGSSNPSTTAENKNIKRTSERKRGKAEKSISLDVLQQYFSGSLKDAAKSLGVCPTTMKRICRQHGIARWPSRKINKVNRSLSKLKRVIESVQGADGTFDLTSFASSPLAVPATSPWTPCMDGVSQQDLPGTIPFDLKLEFGESASCKTMGNNGQVRIEDNLPPIGVVNRDVPQEQYVLQPDFTKGSNSSRSGSSSKEESAGTPTSHNSCQGSPANENMFVRDPTASSILEQFVKVGGSPEFHIPPISTCIMPNALSKKDQKPLGRVLIEESGSSKDLKNLCHSAADALHDDGAPESSWTNPPFNNLTPKQTMATLITTVSHVIPRQRTNSMTIKATYRDDIIRFRFPLGSSIVELREEIAKRFKIDVGTFDIKYLDDDNEWVLIACDADLQECLDIASSSGSHAVRLLVHDVMSNLGSSCESNGG